ncbi:MAG: hypothetical protein ACYC3S_16810 [Chloroflexota bacterium]
MVENRDHGQEPAGEEHATEVVHLPGPSFWPLVLAISLVAVAVGMIFQPVVAVVAGVAALASIIAWGLEGSH